MIQFDEQLVPAVEALRHLLISCRYDAVQKAIREYQYFIDPWPNYKEFKKLIATVAEPLRSCYELLLLGDTIERTRVEKLLDPANVATFLAHGFFVEEKEGIRTNSLCIISYLDHYFLAELPYFFPTCRRKNAKIYMGADSYWLAHNHVSGFFDSVLDLCTGTGIQAILSSISAKNVIAVDLNENAVNAARFNVILNNVEDRIEVREGNLYEAVDESGFDLIYANPPFLPVPENIEYPLAGDGGKDGLLVLGKIIDGLETHLNPNGQAIIISEVVGDRNGPFLDDALLRLRNKGWDIQILVRGDMPLFFQAKMIAQLTSNIYGRDGEKAELTDKWKNLYQEINAEYLYPVVLFLRHEVTHRYETIKPYQRWHTFDKPVVRSNISFNEAISSYEVKIEGKGKIGEIDCETYDFLNFCNGSHRIEDIVMKLIPKYQKRYESSGVDKALMDAISVCDTLERMGVISNAQGK
jgi:hypothetical protein